MALVRLRNEYEEEREEEESEGNDYEDEGEVMQPKAPKAKSLTPRASSAGRKFRAASVAPARLPKAAEKKDGSMKKRRGCRPSYEEDEDWVEGSKLLSALVMPGDRILWKRT